MLTLFQVLLIYSYWEQHRLHLTTELIQTTKLQTSSSRLPTNLHHTTRGNFSSVRATYGEPNVKRGENRSPETKETGQLNKRIILIILSPQSKPLSRELDLALVLSPSTPRFTVFLLHYTKQKYHLNTSQIDDDSSSVEFCF